MFKSTDGGASWRALTGLPSTIVTVLAIAPSAPATVYVGMRPPGTGPGGLFKTTNGGETWSPVGAGLPAGLVESVAVHPHNPNTVYAGVSNPLPLPQAGASGTFKSVDGGATWTALQVAPPQQPDNVGFAAKHLLIDPLVPSTVYAWGREMFKSTDAGATWIRLHVPQSPSLDPPLGDDTVPAMVIDPQTPTTFYVGTYLHGVFKSTDGGATWSNTNLPLPVYEASALSLAIHPTTPGTVYAGTSHGVFKTTDGGGSWSPVNVGLPPEPWSAAALAVDPLTPTTVVVGTSNFGVFKSTDGAATWAPAGRLASSLLDVLVDPTSPATVYVSVSRGGVFRSVDGG